MTIITFIKFDFRSLLLLNIEQSAHKQAEIELLNLWNCARNNSLGF